MRSSTPRSTGHDSRCRAPGRGARVSSVERVRRLIEHRGKHRVVSVYLDLDPERFATPPARASQIRSLLDEGAREVDRLDGLPHEDKVGLREDLKRIDS